MHYYRRFDKGAVSASLWSGYMARRIRVAAEKEMVPIASPKQAGKGHVESRIVVCYLLIILQISIASEVLGWERR